jgi:hypothetical protein
LEASPEGCFFFGFFLLIFFPSDSHLQPLGKKGKRKPLSGSIPIANSDRALSLMGPRDYQEIEEPCSKLQGMFCLAAVLRADRKEVCYS